MGAVLKPKVMRWDVVNELATLGSEGRVLEIGVQRGVCGSRLQAREKWGVDPEPIGNAERHYTRFFACTSDQFFARLVPDRLFDVVFVDGLHHADQVLRDVENALKHLAPGGAVVLHDCNPQSEAAQRVPRATGVWNGDCWKAVVALRRRADLDVFTIDTDEGVGIVTKRPSVDGALTSVPEVLTYDVLERARERLLGLVPAPRWTERFGAPLALGRVVVLSAIFGNRDLAAPTSMSDADECVLYTDGDGAAGWRVVEARAEGGPRRAARRIKTLALDLEPADIVVWIDGRITITGVPLRPLLRRALARADVAGFPHPWRSTVASEALECARLGYAPPAALEHQVEGYRAAGFRDDRGLWNTMVLARRATPAVRELGRDWWQHITEHTERDQVSLPYLLWKHGLRCAELGPDVYSRGASPHFLRGAHNA